MTTGLELLTQVTHRFVFPRNIRRIVFHDLEKFNGSELVTLSPEATKQIAGRAGRYGKAHSRGEVTT